MDKLTKRIQEYADKGMYEDVYKAARQAQIATRAFIERLHPRTAFGGKSLITDQYNGHTNNQIIKGTFKTLSETVNANLYANYFARWYNTGIYGQPPRGTVIQSNAKAIEQYYQDTMLKYLRENLKIKG